MPANLSAPPLQDAIVDLAAGPAQGAMTRVFAHWLRSLVDRLQTAAAWIVRTGAAGLAASVGLTALVPVATGLYRVSWRFRVTQAATTSSSLQFTLTTTDGGITVSQSSAAYTGNVTNAPQSGVFIVKADPSTPLSYSLTYGSVGATPMQFEYDVSVEQL